MTNVKKSQTSNSELLELKKQKFELLQREAKRRHELPHLYAYKMFWWQRSFWDSVNKYTFLTCANQCGKSIISYCKAVRIATDKELQKQLFPDPLKPMPTYAFYFLPSLKLATREFENKIVTQVLPRGSMKDDPQYGWDAVYRDKEISSIKFKNGFSIYFMSYSQKPEDLQASTPAFVGADEEMPQELVGEVFARLVAGGPGALFWLVCTPTRGDEYWRKVFEQNMFPNAHVIRATMYDCLKFEDGSPGTKTVAEIEDFKAKLPTRQAVEVRVYGKFARSEGLKFPTFDPEVHVKPAEELPLDWKIFTGIDIGGGGSAHPAAITFAAVDPNYKRCRIIKTWRGGPGEITTSPDILAKYLELKEPYLEKGYVFSGEYYDFASKEFGTTAMRAGETIMPAEKSHEIGESIINTLFKHQLIVIDKVPGHETLVDELVNLKSDSKKRHATDDQIDSLRYSLSKIPFQIEVNLSRIVKEREAKSKVTKKRTLQRGDYEVSDGRGFLDDIEAETSFWNDQLD